MLSALEIPAWIPSSRLQTQFLIDKQEHVFYNVRTGCDRAMMIAARTVFGGMRRFLEVAALRDRGDRH